MRALSHCTHLSCKCKPPRSLGFRVLHCRRTQALKRAACQRHRGAANQAMAWCQGRQRQQLNSCGNDLAASAYMLGAV